MKTEKLRADGGATALGWRDVLLIAVIIAVVASILVVAVLGMLWEAGAF